MKTQYFTLINNSTQPKNSLQKEIWSYIEQQSNRLIVEVEVEIIELRLKIESFNNAYPRCAPMSVRVNRYNQDAISLYIRLQDGDQGPGINFIYHKVKTTTI